MIVLFNFTTFSISRVYPRYDKNVASPNSSTTAIKRHSIAFFTRLFGDERTVNILILTASLVFLMHCGVWLWLQQFAKQITPAKPVLMAVSFVPVKAPKPKLAPPPPPHPPSENTTLRRKSQPKPRLKTVPIAHELSDFSPIEQVIEALVPPPLPSLDTVATENATDTKAEPFFEATNSANYADNPKPDYPLIALRQGLQGQVALRVQVSDQGISETIQVQQSSGHDMLDESAVEAVKKWRFIPARRGETRIACQVILPIVFTLIEQTEA